MKFLNLYAGLTVFSLAACTSVVSTNDAASFPTPRLSSTETLANIEVKDTIKGEGCASQYLYFITTGDSKYLQQSGNSPSKHDLLEKAKSAATFDALGTKDGLTTDLLINPVWSIQDDDYWLSKRVCAKVIGYRGVINGFKKAESVTRTEGAKEDNSITIEEITSAAGSKLFQVRKAK